MNYEVIDTPLSAIEGDKPRSNRGVGSKFASMRLGQSFLIPAGDDNYEKNVRNAKAAARSFNKTSNAIKIEWITNAKGTYFGTVPGPGAKPEEPAPPAEPAVE